MIIGKSKRELEKMRAAGQLVGQVLLHLRTLVQPGVTTIEIDRAAEKMIRDAGALPTFKGYNKFPYSICASVNEQVVHGFPSNYRLQEGDIFSIDVGVTLEGFVGDTATTVPVGRVSEDRLKLIRVTQECLERAIEQCWPGKHLGDIGWAVQEHAESRGFHVIRNFVGHGIGRKMHEEPQVYNYGKRGRGLELREGMVLAIEPMLCEIGPKLKTRIERAGGNGMMQDVKTDADGWTARTLDGALAAHFENSIAVTANGPWVLGR